MRASNELDWRCWIAGAGRVDGKRIGHAENGAAVVTSWPNGSADHASCALLYVRHPSEAVCDQILQKNERNARAHNPFGPLVTTGGVQAPEAFKLFCRSVSARHNHVGRYR